jgi:hypothetical protein
MINSLDHLSLSLRFSFLYYIRLPAALARPQVFIYTANFDMVCGALGVERMYYNLPWAGQRAWQAAPRQIWSSPLPGNQSMYRYAGGDPYPLSLSRICTLGCIFSCISFFSFRFSPRRYLSFPSILFVCCFLGNDIFSVSTTSMRFDVLFPIHSGYVRQIAGFNVTEVRLVG